MDEWMNEWMNEWKLYLSSVEKICIYTTLKEV